MLIKNKLTLIIFLIFQLCIFASKAYADEFDISATEIIVDKEKNLIIGSGNVKAKDSDGKLIKANKITYERSNEFLKVEDSVEIIDENGNILKTDKATYDKKKEIIITYQNSELLLNDGYQLSTNKILYNNIKKIIGSDQNSILTDIDGNKIEVEMFEYNIEKNLFSSVGKVKITDINKNLYFFKEVHVDTKKKEMIGSDASVLLDQENFGLSKNNDPRFVANDIYLSKDKSSLSKGIFTTCKIRDGKCPPWSLKAKKIEHDKIKKTIYYNHAVLKVYDVPIFYFPKFFHPDPSVKRKSGLLTPFFSDVTATGTGFGLPYFWAISHDKDLTFTPKFYANENMVLMNEYRQVFENANLILDTSYNQGYKSTSSTKTDGSRNHIFADLNIKLTEKKDYESDLSFKVQQVSNDTYFRVHDINSSLVNAENTNLKNEFNYNFVKNDFYLNVSSSVYEDLREKTNKRYEYILPNILIGNSLFSEKYGSFNLKSNALYKNYSVNKHLTSLTNDIIWNSNSQITPRGFVNNFEGMLRNKNYEAKKTDEYKTSGSVNELSGVLGFKTSFPLQKKSGKLTKVFSPNFMLRYAPLHMRDVRDEDVRLSYSNLYSMNKTLEIERGLSSILGFEYKINEKNKNGDEIEKLSLSLGQVFNSETNKDIPSKSSLDQKMSDVVGEINYNFGKIGKIDYKFSLDHNYEDLNYNEISTSLNFGKVEFNLDYLEEQNHIGSENYVNSGISLNFSDNNKLSFQTKKNFKTDSTELYDISYQYTNDCLTAGLVFRREFYEDSDIEQKDSLMFKITFVPFTSARAPIKTP